jgi:hypothetical protein
LLLLPVLVSCRLTGISFDSFRKATVFSVSFHASLVMEELSVPSVPSISTGGGNKLLSSSSLQAAEKHSSPLISDRNSILFFYCYGFL